MINDSRPIIFSFFSGCGFLDLGFEKSGFDVRFVNEFHKPFHEAYKYARQNMELPEPSYEHHLGSIDEFLEGNSEERLRKYIQTAKKDALVGFIGGPPCPDFSAAGKHKGRYGDNGRLTEAFVQAIVLHKPDFFLIENVKGLWRTEKHKVFYYEMRDVLQKAGYLLTDRLTNSIEYGAPQDRDRILLFGIKETLTQNKNLALLDDVFPWEKFIKFDKKSTLKNNAWPIKDEYIEYSDLKRPSALTPDLESLTVEYWFNKNDVNNHPNTEHYFKPRQGLIRFQSIMEGDNSGKSFKRLHRWRYSPTVAYGNNEVHLHPYQSRRLSVAEALAIQSLPKEFVLPPDMTLTNMFKTIGNGVPFMLSSAIAATIKDFLDEI